MSLFSDLNALGKSHGSKKALTTYADNLFSFLLNKKRWRAPLYLSWNITYQCNCQCNYCTVDKLHQQNNTELKSDQIKQVIKHASLAGTSALSLTGGEPLMKNDILEIIKSAKENKLRTNLNTNGILLEQYAKELVELQVDSITVAMDSADPAIHDKIKNYPGAFKACKDGIEKIKQLRSKSKTKIEIRTVISKNNYLLLDKIIDFWHDRVDKIWFQPIHHGVETCLHNVSFQNRDLLEIDAERFEENFKNLQKKYKFLQTAYYNEFPRYFKDKKALGKKYKCNAGVFNLKIDPYGDVFACSRMIHKIGNIKENTLPEIWKSQELSKIRKMLKEGGNDCFCFTNDTQPSFYLNKIISIFK